MTSAVVAAAGAAVLGPLTLLLAHRTMRASWRPGVTETAAVVAAAGCSSLIATDWAWTLPVGLPLALAGPAIAAVDAREGRLPDVLTVPLFATTLLLTATTGTAGLRAVGGAAAVTAGAVIAAVLARNALGWGDVKLLPTVALVLGGHDALAAGLLRILILLGVTVVLVWMRDRHALVPYGPALVVGSLGTTGW